MKEERRDDEARQLYARVDTLRDRPYMGCGFHYGLVAQAGAILRDFAPDRWATLDAFSRIVIEVCYDSLLDQVEKAEVSAVRLARRRRREEKA